LTATAPNLWAAGQELSQLVAPPITRGQLVRYAGASGDFNPLHYDDEAARQQGFDAVIAHGMLSMGLLGHYVTHLAGPDRVRTLSARFRAVVKLGDVLTCRGRVRDVTDGVARLEVWVENQNGESVTTGEADVVIADPDPSR
jgi:acyl dehydratase